MKTTTVIYFPGDDSIIFALAAALEAGYNIHPAIQMNELWDIESEKIILLNIESNETKFVDLGLYLNLQQSRICGTVKLDDLYFAADENKFNSKEISLIWKILKRNKCYINDAILMQAEYSENTDIRIKRYTSALRASLVKATNTRDMLFYYKTLENIAREIQTKRDNLEIDILARYNWKMINATNEALERISFDHAFMIPNRNVAYAYLSNISPWLDMYNLKQQALEKFGYLIILQYRLHNEDYTWIGSQQIDVRQFFDLPRKGDQHEILLIGSHQYISRLIKKRILDLIQ